ncbi:Flp family type IVb pilin [Variovorax gossypii]
MINSIIRFLRDEEGATAIEYGIIAGLISVAIVAVIPGLGTKLALVFTTINNKLIIPS